MISKTSEVKNYDELTNSYSIYKKKVYSKIILIHLQNDEKVPNRPMNHYSKRQNIGIIIINTESPE